MVWTSLPRHIKSETVLLQGLGKKCVYLLGTAHVSKDSCQNARDLVTIVKPKAVFIELCQKRFDIVDAPDEKELVKKKPKLKELLKGLRSGEQNIFSIAYSYLLSDIGKELDVLPGEEFRVAYEAGVDIGADLILGDRDVNITIKRVWQGLTFMQKVRLIHMLVFSGGGTEIPESKEEFKAMVESMKQRGDQMTAAILELGEEFPWMLECLIRERDIYMTYGLQKALDSYPDDSQIVAVVGAGHVDGIVNLWNEKKSIEELAEMVEVVTKYPGMDTGAGGVYTAKRLRAYANSRESSVKEYLLRLKQTMKNQQDTTDEEPTSKPSIDSSAPPSVAAAAATAVQSNTTTTSAVLWKSPFFLTTTTQMQISGMSLSPPPAATTTTTTTRSSTMFKHCLNGL